MDQQQFQGFTYTNPNATPTWILESSDFKYICKKKLNETTMNGTCKLKILFLLIYKKKFCIVASWEKKKDFPK